MRSGAVRRALLPAVAALAVASCSDNGTEAPRIDLAHLLPELVDMAFIPGGRIDPVFGDGTQVDVPPFFIDRFETTNQEYAEFVAGPGYGPSSPYTLRHWLGAKRPPPGREHHPAVWVSFDDAAGYARFRGKRLPTEVEWRLAARRNPLHLYPWGSAFYVNRCNSLEAGIGDTTVVGTFESGRNDYGCYDFSGNVWEWTNSPTEVENRRVVLGGSFAADRWECVVPTQIPHGDSTERLKYGYYIYTLLTGDLSSDVGFRCVRDVTPALLERIETAARAGDPEVSRFCDPILKVLRGGPSPNEPPGNAAAASR